MTSVFSEECDPAVRRLKIAAPALILSGSLEVLSVLLIINGWGGVAYLAASLLHIAAAAVIWMGTRACKSQRELMAALVLTLPLVGPPLAALALATEGRGNIDQFMPRSPVVVRSLTSADVRRLTEGLSGCEALISSDLDERRKTLALLKHRADSVSISLLRWAISGPDGDLAVEAALVLEDLNVRFETRVASVRTATDVGCTFDSAVAAGDALADGIHSGLVDPELRGPLIREARQYYERSQSIALERLPEMAVRWARLELVARSPDAALAVLDRASLVGGGEAFATLRGQLLGTAQGTLPL